MDIFHRVRWINLNGYGNVWTTVDLDRADSVLIYGKNGSGKSTFLDAVHFCLTGEPFRNVKKGTIVNSINDRDMLAELEWSRGSTDYKIRRGLKPNVFEIYQDGKMLNQNAKAKDMQAFLEQSILGYRAKTIPHIMILGSACHTPFMQLNAGMRRLVVEDMLAVSAFAAMSEITKRLSSNTRSRISEARERERILIERERGKIELLTKTRESTAERIAEIEEDIKGFMVKGNELKEEHTKLQEEYPLTPPWSGRHHQLKHVIPQVQSSLTKQEIKLENATNDLIKLRQPAPKCDVCGQEFPIENLQEKIEAATADIKKKQENFTKLSEELVVWKNEFAELDKLREVHDEGKRRMASIESEFNLIGSQYKKLKDRLKSLKDSNVDTSEIEREIEEVRSEIREKLAKIEDDQSELRHLNAFAEMLRDDGVKAKIVRTYLPLINKLVNDYLEKLDFDVKFYLDETFEETIKSRGRDTFQYNNFSEGEKQRIDLAILFAWMEIAKIKNSVSTNLLILDEIGGGSLDEEGVKDFIKILRGLEGVSSFVISHNVAFREALDREIEVVKVRGFSQMLDTPV